MNGHTSTKYLRPTINMVHQTEEYAFSRVDTYSRDSIDNITFSLHLALNIDVIEVKSSKHVF